MLLDFLRKTFYDAPYIRRLWGASMPEKYGDDRLVFELSSDDHIELDLLGEGFAGLARHFHRHLEEGGLDPEKAPSKLFVTQLQSNSVEFELATLSLLYAYVTSAADGFVIWTDFYGKVRRTLDYLTGRETRPDNYSLEDAKDYSAFLRTIAGKKGARLNVRRAKFHQKTGVREILSEFEFQEQDLISAHMTLSRDLTEIEPQEELPTPRHKTENGVPFIWFRTDREKGKSGGQTSDRGIVAKITDKPLPVFFASEIENIKNKMVKVKNNPFDLVYSVDVAIEHDAEGDPKSYTILNIHDIVGAQGGDS